MYEPLNLENIEASQSNDTKPLPLFEPYQIYQKVKKMKKKSSTIINDLPWKIIQEFAAEIAEPLLTLLLAIIVEAGNCNPNPQNISS